MFPEKIHKKKLTKTSLKQNLKGQKKIQTILGNSIITPFVITFKHCTVDYYVHLNNNNL
jgi:hypothetical protein